MVSFLGSRKLKLLVPFSSTRIATAVSRNEYSMGTFSEQVRFRKVYPINFDDDFHVLGAFWLWLLRLFNIVIKVIILNIFVSFCIFYLDS